jgi:hypothetical protein
VVGKLKTIQFTVTCVMITIVQKIVILKSILDHGRSSSCRLSAAFHQSSDAALVTTTKYLRSSNRNFVYLLIKETLELYHVLYFYSINDHYSIIPYASHCQSIKKYLSNLSSVCLRRSFASETINKLPINN